MKKNITRGCMHCGDMTIQSIVAHYKNVEHQYYEGSYMETVPVYYVLTRCNVCHKISLYSFWAKPFGHTFWSGIQKAKILYPYSKEFVDNVPKVIIKTYKEAQKIKKASPTAFAVMIRRALEFLCLENGAK